MLQFQDNNTTVIATFEDFILTNYVIIDNLYHDQLVEGFEKRMHRRYKIEYLKIKT